MKSIILQLLAHHPIPESSPTTPDKYTTASPETLCSANTPAKSSKKSSQATSDDIAVQQLRLPGNILTV